jgi:rubrerythrin
MSAGKSSRRASSRQAHANHASLTPRKRTIVSCHACGYDADDVRTELPCPKCGGHQWETTVISERLVPEEV